MACGPDGRQDAACYWRLAATLRERSEAIALLVTSEMGKTIGSARAEVEKCAATLEWLAEYGPAILADEAGRGGWRATASTSRSCQSARSSP